MDEAEMVKRVLAGDQGAQQEFYVAYRDRLYRTCVHFLGYQDDDAQDIVQQVFLIAHQKMGAFDFQHKLSTWLTQIAVNLCFARLRQRKRTLLLLEEELEAVVNRGGGSAGPGEPGEEEVREQRLGLVKRVIGMMGEPCQRMLELRDLAGESYVAIARVLSVPIGTVMSRLSRCRALLKQQVLVAMELTS